MFRDSQARQLASLNNIVRLSIVLPHRAYRFRQRQQLLLQPVEHFLRVLHFGLPAVKENGVENVARTFNRQAKSFHALLLHMAVPHVQKSQMMKAAGDQVLGRRPPDGDIVRQNAR